MYQYMKALLGLEEEKFTWTDEELKEEKEFTWTEEEE